MKKYIEDIFILSGLATIVFGTFLISTIGGIYCLGAVLFGVGIWFAKNPPREG